jgi:hypothetical protein
MSTCYTIITYYNNIVNRKNEVEGFGQISGKDLDDIKQVIIKKAEQQAVIVNKLQANLDKKIGEIKADLASEQAKLNALHKFLGTKPSKPTTSNADQIPNKAQ